MDHCARVPGLGGHARSAAFPAELSTTAEDDASPPWAEGRSSMQLHNPRRGPTREHPRTSTGPKHFGGRRLLLPDPSHG
jgi:hypothetical protein